MEDIKKKLKDEVILLSNEGRQILFAELAVLKRLGDSDLEKVDKKRIGRITKDYQSWYSKALPVIKQLLPERYQEFQEQYRIEKRNVQDISIRNYTIYDYLTGTHIPGLVRDASGTVFSNKFQHQIAILLSARDRIDFLLNDIEGVLQSNLFYHEIEIAEELLKKNHLRAAGALAGVSLELHLSRVCDNHSIKLKTKNPHISDYNNALKEENIFDIPNWRHIQHLGDIRNLCVHKGREPTKEEIDTLISGTKKIFSTIF